MQNYSFVTTWKYPVPVEKIWPVIKQIENWPQWWKGVKQVHIITPGNPDGLGKKATLTWKSVLPYQLTFKMEVTEITEFKKISGITSGSLQGSGIWIFKEENNASILKFFWEVNTTKGWMNLLAPILRPVFIWNHDLVMKWGERGLAKKLEVDV